MNRQVKCNIERFPEDFMFQLTKEEYNSLKCQIGTSNKRGGDRRALPYAFTQQGIGMLSGLLRSQVAIDTNIRIMRAFVNLRRFLLSNAQIFHRLDNVEQKQLENKVWMEQTDNKINTILAKMEDNSSKLLPEQISGTGCVWDAWSYVSDLIRSAKQKIILIDNFVDDRVHATGFLRADNHWPSQSRNMLSRTRTRSMALLRRFFSWKSNAPSMKLTRTLLRLTMLTTLTKAPSNDRL